MANHKSALKRIRRNEVARVRNRYQHRTMRNALKALRGETEKANAEKQLPVVISMIDRLAKNNIIHNTVLTANTPPNTLFNNIPTTTVERPSFLIPVG